MQSLSYTIPAQPWLWSVKLSAANCYSASGEDSLKLLLIAESIDQPRLAVTIPFLNHFWMNSREYDLWGICLFIHLLNKLLRILEIPAVQLQYVWAMASRYIEYLLSFVDEGKILKSVAGKSQFTKSRFVLHCEKIWLNFIFWLRQSFLPQSKLTKTHRTTIKNNNWEEIQALSNNALNSINKSLFLHTATENHNKKLVSKLRSQDFLAGFNYVYYCLVFKKDLPMRNFILRTINKQNFLSE